MALRELAILLSARGQPQTSGAINKVTKSVSTLDRVAGRAGKGIRTLGSNLKTMAGGAALIGVGVGIAAVKSGIDSLIEREGVIATTAAAIESTGQAAKFSAPEIRAWSEAIETATGAAVDDKAIQAGANNLLRFGTISHDIFERALADATDLGAGMKTGPEAASKLLGKALSDPVKAMGTLRKAGIVLTKAEETRIKQLVKGNKVQDAQVVLLAAVEKRYKGAAAASVGPYQKSLNILKDVAEDAKMALAEGLLPVITKVAEKLSKKLADPKVLGDIRGFGQSLAKGFDKALQMAEKIPWSTIGDSMKLAGQGAKMALDLFTSMPPWVQTAVITGWGLNKLSGGAVGGIIGELGKGLIKGVLGVNAGVVNIKAGVVNGGGLGAAGKAGAAGGAVGVVGKGAGIAGKALGALAVVGSVLGVFETWSDQNQNSTDKGNEIAARQEEWLKGQPKRADLVTGLAGVKQGIHDITSNPLNTLVQGEALDKLRAMQAGIEASLGKLDAIAAARTTINYIAGERAGAPSPLKLPGAGPRNTHSNRDQAVNVNVRTSVSARESHHASTQWRRVSSANGSPVTID